MRLEDFYVGGSNLTNANYVNVGDQVKFIDTIKYYQQSLSKLAETVTAGEKKSIRIECKKYLKSHFYFKNIWQSLNETDKNCVLNYLLSG